MEYINVQFLDMDTKIPEHLVLNKDGSYTVFINARLSYDKQREAYAHAMRHIKNNDFDKTNADEIEYDAHYLEFALEFCG